MRWRGSGKKGTAPYARIDTEMQNGTKWALLVGVAGGRGWWAWLVEVAGGGGWLAWLVGVAG